MIIVWRRFRYLLPTTTKLLILHIHSPLTLPVASDWYSFVVYCVALCAFLWEFVALRGVAISLPLLLPRYLAAESFYKFVEGLLQGPLSIDVNRSARLDWCICVRRAPLELLIWVHSLTSGCLRFYTASICVDERCTLFVLAGRRAQSISAHPDFGGHSYRTLYRSSIKEACLKDLAPKAQAGWNNFLKEVMKGGKNPPIS